MRAIQNIKLHYHDDMVRMAAVATLLKQDTGDTGDGLIWVPRT